MQTDNKIKWDIVVTWLAANAFCWGFWWMIALAIDKTTLHK